MARVGRKVGVLVVHCAFNRWTLAAVGWTNRRLRLIDSVFVVYPATERYARDMTYEWLLRRNRWSPFMGMVFKQGRRFGVTFGIGATEEQIRRASPEQLEELHRRAERVRQLLGAQYVTFSGILPGQMDRMGVDHGGREAETTVHVIRESIAQVLDQEDYDPDTPVVVIGAAGYIGSRLSQELAGRPVFPVDPSLGISALPEELRGQRAIVVNVASSRALAKHLDSLWSEAIYLNEVYPEPRGEQLAALREAGVATYHVVGVKGAAMPPFPRAYRGGIPCCAAIPSARLEPRVRRL